MSAKAIDLLGNRYGRLVVLSRSSNKPKRSNVIWFCACDCGGVANIRADVLRSGTSQSCGCLRRELTGSKSLKHGHAKGLGSRTYRSWQSMKERCENQNHVAFRLYGGRGIKVCERWDKFSNFLEDMGERSIGKTLDRIDSNRNYEVSNCRWATPSEQNREQVGVKKTLRVRKLRDTDSSGYAYQESEVR